MQKMTENLANGYSYESAQQELSNEYPHDRVQMVFNFFCVIVLWMKVASAVEGLSPAQKVEFGAEPIFSYIVFFQWILAGNGSRGGHPRAI